LLLPAQPRLGNLLNCQTPPAMKPLPYTLIKSSAQYESYQSILDFLTDIKKKSKNVRETIELLNLLTEKWESDQNKKLPKTNPVDLLQRLMDKNNPKAADLATDFGVSKSLVSDILCLRRGFSKKMSRKLSTRFKVPEELFNKPYKLRD
jgi:HTH-type transcriptional regulator / antitoxin HigA